MTGIRTPLAVRLARWRLGGGPLGRLIPRLLSLVVLSTVGLTAVQGGIDALSDDDSDRDERIVFRHFL